MRTLDVPWERDVLFITPGPRALNNLPLNARSAKSKKDNIQTTFKNVLIPAASRVPTCDNLL